MKALMLVDAGKFQVLDMPDPTPGPDDVVIRIRACGICGSDVHGMDGSTGRRIPPIVMGHEASGEIVALGQAVQGWRVSDRVTFDSTVFCGACSYCDAGQINLCKRRQVVGVSCAEYRRHGAYAELAVVPARTLYRLPPQLGFEEAALAEPVAVALHAVALAQVRNGDKVAVIGCGMIGLLVIQVLMAKFGCAVTAIDIDERKLSLALKYGAVREGVDHDVAIEVVGLSSSITGAIRTVKRGGRVVLVGNVSPMIEIPLQEVVTREITLVGSCASRGEYSEALSLLTAGAIDTDVMISQGCSLEEAPGYFERLRHRDPKLLKVMVCP